MKLRKPIALAAAIFIAMATAAFASTSYLPTIEQAPAFTLVDSQGRSVRSASLKGSVVLLDFMYTHCATVCPMVTRRMQSVAARLRKARLLGTEVRLVSISFDPVRDTPAWLNTYARSVGADPRAWMFLTGTPAEIAALLGRYDFHVTQTKTGDFDHVSRVYLIDSAGRIRQIYSVAFLDPARVERDITSLLAEARQAQRQAR